MKTYRSLPTYISRFAKDLYLESVGTIIPSSACRTEKIYIDDIVHLIAFGGFNITDMTVNVSQQNEYPF